MTKLFISYAKKDTRKLALNLAAALNAIDGVSVWVDKSLRAGRSWELQIQKHIDECDTMIVLYSPDINRHKQGQPESYVLTEIAYAKYTLGKPIIPVMAQQTTPPMALTMAQYIDFTLDGLELEDLVVALCDELHIDPTRKQAQAADTPAPTRQLRKAKDRPVVVHEFLRIYLDESFEWCEISDGDFIYGGDEKARNSAPYEVMFLPTFYVAKYPITYKQFQAFIDHQNGFDDSRWWSGLAHKSDKPHKQRWKFDDYPRENVTWYEAIAFCRWLSWSIGGGYEINDIGSWRVRLPTEFEWEKAARGTDGRFYPYGNSFDESKGNTEELGIKQTTPVTHYPQGASPYGVLDMSGNVLEWCLSDTGQPSRSAADENMDVAETRVLRGGSWEFNYEYARCSSRISGKPHISTDDSGFRIMCPAATD